MSDSLPPHGLQHTRLPCPSPTTGAYSNSCPSSQWCHPTISFSVVPLSSCLQSFPASGSCQMSQSFMPSGQSIGVSASASVIPMNVQGWFPLGSTGLIYLVSKDHEKGPQERREQRKVKVVPILKQSRNGHRHCLSSLQPVPQMHFTVKQEAPGQGTAFKRCQIWRKLVSTNQVPDGGISDSQWTLSLITRSL